MLDQFRQEFRDEKYLQVQYGVSDSMEQTSTGEVSVRSNDRLTDAWSGGDEKLPVPVSETNSSKILRFLSSDELMLDESHGRLEKHCRAADGTREHSGLLLGGARFREHVRCWSTGKRRVWVLDAVVDQLVHRPLYDGLLERLLILESDSDRVSAWREFSVEGINSERRTGRATAGQASQFPDQIGDSLEMFFLDAVISCAIVHGQDSRMLCFVFWLVIEVQETATREGIFAELLREVTLRGRLRSSTGARIQLAESWSTILRPGKGWCPVTPEKPKCTHFLDTEGWYTWEIYVVQCRSVALEQPARDNAEVPEKKPADQNILTGQRKVRNEKHNADESKAPETQPHHKSRHFQLLRELKCLGFFTECEGNLDSDRFYCLFSVQYGLNERISDFVCLLWIMRWVSCST